MASAGRSWNDSRDRYPPTTALVWSTSASAVTIVPSGSTSMTVGSPSGRGRRVWTWTPPTPRSMVNPVTPLMRLVGSSRQASVTPRRIGSRLDVRRWMRSISSISDSTMIPSPAPRLDVALRR